MSGFPAIVLKPEFLLQPLIFYLLLAAGMASCLYLFATLKTETRALLRRCQEDGNRIQALETALHEARQTGQSLESDLRAVERQTGMLVAPAPARSGLNLSKRTHVLRMHRAGQDNTAIAAALALPRAEVDLLIKVHRIVVEQL
ncbi:MAG: hypothetical protein ACLP59_17735 [Bryobacteraceae bacterium]